MGKSFTTDQVKKRNARYGFDYTTGSGQKKLMYKSMGRDIDPDAKVDMNAKGDYGHDPLGDGKFKMVPSGDIVDYEEMKRRLARFHKEENLAKRLFGLVEGSLGRLSGDASDILTGIVNKNKDKSGKDILNIVKQDKELQDEIKGIPDDELLTYINDELRLANVFGTGKDMSLQKEHNKVSMEGFMSRAKSLIHLVEDEEYYEAEYYLEVGEHGSVGDFPTFEEALKRAREIEVDEETWYTGVSGSGSKFAIVHVTENYIDLMSKREAFADENTKKA